VACCESEDQPHLIDGLHRVAAALGGLSRDWRFDRMATLVTPGTRPDALGPRSCRSLLAEARDEVDRCGDDDRTEEVGQQCVT